MVRRLVSRLDVSAPFVALDFETADYGNDSACALGLVRVENLAIVDRKYSLFRPPRLRFTFTHIHGIAWAHVKNSPTFAEAWPDLSRTLEGAAFLVAHNADFDRGVLEACCYSAKLRPPTLPYLCTVKLARLTWKLTTGNLPDVCRFLGLPLKHHDAASDAEACANIAIAALKKHRSLFDLPRE